jgi:hypothetical protein
VLPGTFVVGFTSPSGAAQNTVANLFGDGLDDITARTATASTDHATFEAFGTSAGLRDPQGNGFHVTALDVSTDGVNYAAIADLRQGIVNPDGANRAMFGSLRGLFVDGFLLNPVGGIATDPAGKVTNFTNSPGQGALFATAIVPRGTAVIATGSLAGDQGAVSQFTAVPFLPPFPEPSGLIAVMIAFALLSMRRNRRATAVDGSA